MIMKQLKEVNDRVLNAVRLLGFKGDRLPAGELVAHGSDDDDLDFDGGGKKKPVAKKSTPAGKRGKAKADTDDSDFDSDDL